MEVPGKGKYGKTMETWKDIVKRDLELIGVNEALDRRKWGKIIASPIPYLKGLV